MTTKDAIKHLSWKISFAKQCLTHWADCVDVDALEIAVSAMAEERKKGKWIIREALWGETEAKCPCCGFETIVNEPGNGLPMVSDLHYCPNCGAEMEYKNER